MLKHTPQLRLVELRVPQLMRQHGGHFSVFAAQVDCIAGRKPPFTYKCRRDVRCEFDRSVASLAHQSTNEFFRGGHALV